MMIVSFGCMEVCEGSQGLEWTLWRGLGRKGRKCIFHLLALFGWTVSPSRERDEVSTLRAHLPTPPQPDIQGNDLEKCECQ